MKISKINEVFEERIKKLELPDSAYEKAKERYMDIWNWFTRDESRCSKYEPHVFSQGSFRLGTAIYPMKEEDSYDLDLGCELKEGVSKATYTQRNLKKLVGMDLDDYRVARRIDKSVKEKHKCWRLEYADKLNFHMDIVPCIPEESPIRLHLNESLVRAKYSDTLAMAISDKAVAITDDRTNSFSIISDDWPKSNPEGYAVWFEDRMRRAQQFLNERAYEAKAGTIDELPNYKWKTPLQRCIQLLKRHRDIMFKENDAKKPISIIITTLAAHAYNGETSIEAAMAQILKSMGNYVNPVIPRVPNPTNLEEDFSDKWHKEEYKSLNLEKYFWLWLENANQTFGALFNSVQGDFSAAIAQLDESLYTSGLGQKRLNTLLAPPLGVSELRFPDKPVMPKKPQGFARCFGF